MGEAKKLAVAAGGAVEAAHNTLVKFVLIGWAIYPIGYMAGTAGWYGGWQFSVCIKPMMLFITLVMLSTKLDLV